MVESAVERLRGAGVEQVQLWVSTTSTAARRLYEKVGFRVVGCVEGAMKDEGRYIDEELMVLRLRER